MLKVCGKITHASGQSSSVEMQKLDHSPGFRCSFVPPFPGKYSAKLFHCPNGIVEDVDVGIDSKQLCPAIQLDVSRNYSSDARNPSQPMIRLGDNGFKYWGITVNHYADRFYVTDREESDVIVIDSTTSKIIKRFGGRQSSHGFHDGQLYRPSGISVDHVNNRLLVCDKDHHRICMYSMDGLFVSSFGTKGYGPGEFTYPWDVDASSDGKMIAVSDS
ncbi:protein lin-41-like [Folsomia candida]|nr:protein lin-41-like [Folsomia candida]